MLLILQDVFKRLMRFDLLISIYKVNCVMGVSKRDLFFYLGERYEQELIPQGIESNLPDVLTARNDRRSFRS